MKKLSAFLLVFVLLAELIADGTVQSIVDKYIGK